MSEPVNWIPKGPPGRHVGGYVYLLLCRDEEKIYIKVGNTAHPERRFGALRCGCPVTPRSFSVIPLPSKELAERLEKAIHTELDRWRVAGEWFCLQASDKTEFNARLQKVLSEKSMPSWPLLLQKMSATALIKMAANRQAYWRHRYKKFGSAFRDFLNDGGLYA